MLPFVLIAPLESLIVSAAAHHPGLFVTFEGPECAGKSTQSRLLAERLRADGREVLLTREPGGCVLGERLRELLLHFDGDGGLSPEAELLLFAASRAQITRQVIRPHLDRGGVVLCDRYLDSTVAYQGYARGFDRDTIAQVNAVATQGLRPDLTILLDLDAEAIAARANARGEGGNRFEDEDLAFHRRVIDGFRAIAAQEPGRVRLHDAREPVETLHEAIYEAVRHALAPLR